MTSHYSLLKIKGQAVFQRQSEGRKRRLAVANWVLETPSLISAAEGLVCPIFQRGSEPRREHKASGETDVSLTGAIYRKTAGHVHTMVPTLTTQPPSPHPHTHAPTPCYSKIRPA